MEKKPFGLAQITIGTGEDAVTFDVPGGELIIRDEAMVDVQFAKKGSDGKMEINGIEFDEAVWTNDCGGKQDFDFSVLHVSTRYWRDYTARPTIYLGDQTLRELPPGVYIEGESEAECKMKTEAWIKEELQKILKCFT